MLISFYPAPPGLILSFSLCFKAGNGTLHRHPEKFQAGKYLADVLRNIGRTPSQYMAMFALPATSLAQRSSVHTLHGRAAPSCKVHRDGAGLPGTHGQEPPRTSEPAGAAGGNLPCLWHSLARSTWWLPSLLEARQEVHRYWKMLSLLLQGAESAVSAGHEGVTGVSSAPGSRAALRAAQNNSWLSAQGVSPLGEHQGRCATLSTQQLLPNMCTPGAELCWVAPTPKAILSTQRTAASGSPIACPSCCSESFVFPLLEPGLQVWRASLQ